jgi:hypothetical protein
VSKTVVVETWKQHVGIRVTQSFNVGIITTRVETVVAPNIDVVKRGVLIGFATKLASGSSGVLARRNLNRSSTLPTTTIKVIGIPQVVFINLIMTIHGNMITNQH